LDEFKEAKDKAGFLVEKMFNGTQVAKKGEPY
jgi:hypothetical protein